MLKTAEQLDYIVNKLNCLENISADAETGLIVMRKGKMDYILCACNIEFKKGEYVADYDKMKVEVLNEDGTHDVAHYDPDEVDNYTLKNQRINIVETKYFLGVNDTITGKYIDFPQCVYEIGGAFFDLQLNKIAAGNIFKCTPIVDSFQSVHIINAAFVLITYEDVKIYGSNIQIGDVDGKQQTYSFFSDNNAYGCLVNGDVQIKLNCINTYLVYGAGTFRGLVIPDHRKYGGHIYEIEGIWVGKAPRSRYTQLSPYKPDSGKNTKAATAAAVDT